MMQETIASGTARKADIPGWTAAGKTGTSQDFRDAWFIGYTANLVTGVWLGNDDNSPTKKATGGGLPVEVWTRFMRTAHQGVPVAVMPNSRGVGGFLSNFFQNTAQVSNGPPPMPPQNVQAPVPLRPIPSDGAYRPPPTRASAPPPNPNARPEAGAGLDGWLVDRLFGGNR
jgi:penicillin-binding protein 1A